MNKDHANLAFQIVFTAQTAQTVICVHLDIIFQYHKKILHVILVTTNVLTALVVPQTAHFATAIIILSIISVFLVN